MRGSEVEAAVGADLVERNWDVTTAVPDFTELLTRRGVERLVIEVKGHSLGNAN